MSFYSPLTSWLRGPVEPYSAEVSGPGLRSATANFPSHFSVEINSTRFHSVHAEVHRMDGSLRVLANTSLITIQPAEKGEQDIDMPLQVSAIYSFCYNLTERGRYSLCVMLMAKKLLVVLST